MEARTMIRGMASKPSLFLSKCKTDVSNLRNSLIQSGRVIILSRYIDQVSPKKWQQISHPMTFPFPCNKPYDFILNPPRLSPFLGLSQFTQNTSFLLSFIFDRPDILAKATLSIVKVQKQTVAFNYMVNCIIPSFYGFFSCKEFVEQSVRFYIQIIEKSPPLLTIQILQPLFHSCITYQFFDAVFSRFFRVIIIDEHIQSGKSEHVETYVQIYAQFLIECIVESLRLLPEEVLRILKYIKAKKWSIKDQKLLLINNFFFAELENWLSKSVARVLTDFVREIMCAIEGSDLFTTKILDNIYSAKSVYQLPSIYSTFDQLFSQYFLCCYDIIYVANLLNNIEMYPESVSKKEFKKLPKSSMSDCFFCNVYPRTKKEIAISSFLPLFFGTEKASALKFDKNEEESESESSDSETSEFEKFITYRVYEKEISNVDFCYKRHESQSLLKYIDEIVRNRQMNDSILTVYSSANFPNHLHQDVKRSLFLKLLDAMHSDWLGEYASVLLDFNVLWEELVKELKESRNLVEVVPNMRKFLQPLFVDSVRLLSMIDGQTIYDKFFIMMDAFGFLTKIADCEQIGNTIFEIAFQQNKGKELLSSYFILDAFAMQNNVFKQLCSDFELRCWGKLTDSLQCYLMSSAKYMTVFNTIANYLSTISTRVFK